MKELKLITTLLLLLASALSAQGEDTAAQSFYRGRESFDKKDYSAAIDHYKEAISKGAGGASLFFNLGTACLAEGRNGEGLYYLRRAEVLDPNDEDLQYNLKIARSRAVDKISRSEHTAFVAKLLYFHQQLQKPI